MKKTNFIQSAATFTLLVTLAAAAIGNPSFPPYEGFFENDPGATFRNPSLNFENVWAEHNVIENGRKGMRIHVRFHIQGMKNQTSRLVAYFYHGNGYALVDRDGNYDTRTGTVATGRDFTAPYDKSNANLTLFMPYGELHLNGTYELKYHVSVNFHGRRVGENSAWETFRLTWRTNQPESDCPKCGC